MVDEAYLAFVRGRPCIWCNVAAPSDPDHLRNRKWRNSTRNDYTAVPSCRPCHNRRHNVGTELMLELNGVKIYTLIETVANQLVRYFTLKAAGVSADPNAPF